MTMEKKYLVFVDVKNGIQSNKYYNMFDNGDGTFTAEYGRVGKTKTTHTYPSRLWSSKYASKLKKGYEDITDLKTVSSEVVQNSGNAAFDEFYATFSRYTTDAVAKTYLSQGATAKQLEQAQQLINELSTITDVRKFNTNLLSLYKTIPRQMRDVREHLLTDISQKNSFISKEQDALDSMDSAVITSTLNPARS